ncbi:phosphodiesterase [Nocardiopsis composta]|uniref:3',5'-cyclic AMP phosphodiesterase CpdA n=1 Tax=Nocardiopsis composta TaxID=157465 RepID=A0A7W8QJZ4_9ACTN|nr:phosphodiesterase [Nocardiopsis composta]MBB5431867.1 3',5'-cyclic AMP phosphodiesterase CpdA [Nocardiopsis composta]
MLVLAHISDTHLDGGEDGAERVRRVMGHIRALEHPVDAIVHTGDVVDKGLPEEYRQAAEELRADVPMLLCPGNHDARAPFREFLLGEEPADGPIDGVHRVGRALVAVCDTSVPGEHWGRLAEATLDRLEGVLAAAPADTPVLIALHHHPADLGIAYVDEIRQRDEHRLAALIERYPQVAAVLCGHAHTSAVTSFAGRPLLVAPSVAPQLRMEWEPAPPAGDGAPPPMLALHLLGGDGRLTTHFRAV